MSRFIISRAEGRIYVGIVRTAIYCRSKEDRSAARAIGWGDTDNPKFALCFDSPAAAEPLVAQLKADELQDSLHSILLASPTIRDFQIVPLHSAKQWEGHRLFNPVEAQVDEKKP